MESNKIKFSLRGTTVACSFDREERGEREREREREREGRIEC